MTFKSAARRLAEALDPKPAERPEPIAMIRFARLSRLRQPRGRTLADHRKDRNASGPILAALRAENAELIDGDTFADRPRTAADCPDSGPCPYVGCRHHLYLDVNPLNGALKINFPDADPLDIKEPCTLRLAARGGLTLEDVGQRMNLTRERMRQIETRALITLKRRMPR